MMERANQLDRHQCGHFWGLFDDRKALRLADFGSLCPPRRFSAWLWGASRRPQLWQQFAHRPMHLLRGRRPMPTFPRAQLGFHQIAGQNQMIVGNGHQMRPALKLLRSPQTRLVPEQGLLLKALAMLMAEPQYVPQCDADQVGLGIANPDEPTDARVTLGIAGMRTFDSNHRQIQIARVFDMQVFPPA